MSPVTRRPSLLSNIVSSVTGVPHFVRTFIDSLACLYVAINPIVGLPDSDEPQYRPRGATVAIGPFLFAAMLFGIPTITLAVAVPHSHSLFAFLAFVVSLGPVFFIAGRAKTLNRRYLDGDYTPHVRRIDLAILAVWNAGWLFACFHFWLT